MADRVQVHHLIILDKSGSMHSIRGAVISGFNEIIEQIEEDSVKHSDTQEHYISLVLFNGSVEFSVWQEYIESVDKLSEASYIPNGSTALNDAIGASLNRMKNELGSDLDNGNVKVQVTVISDGYENASQEFTKEASDNLVKTLDKDDPWMFTYIGANQDAKKEAASRGFVNSMNFSPSHTEKAWEAVAHTNSIRSASYDKGVSKTDMYSMSQVGLDEIEKDATVPVKSKYKTDSNKNKPNQYKSD